MKVMLEKIIGTQAAGEWRSMDTFPKDKVTNILVLMHYPKYGNFAMMRPDMLEEVDLQYAIAWTEVNLANFPERKPV